MSYFKWLLAGVVGALVGGAIWVAVGYFGNAEVGWIAWGVGLLAGLGVRFAAGEEEGVGPGVAAVVAAVCMIAASKYVVVSLLVDKAMAEMARESDFTEENQVAMLASEVVEEFQKDNKEVNWPNDVEDPSTEADFPADIWKVARERFDAMPPEERQQRVQQQLELQNQIREMLAGHFKDQAFKASFSPWDLLWLGLASLTAFRVGSGASTDE